MPRTKLAVRVADTVFGIAGEMRRLPAYFDSPVLISVKILNIPFAMDVENIAINSVTNLKS